jgi:hypothetical protein
MLINLSNHPLSKWSDQQRQAAEKQFGKIVDLPFPTVPTDADLDRVIELVNEKVEECMKIFIESKQISSDKNSNHDAVHIMGEMTFVYQFVDKMSEQGILCVASTKKDGSNEFVQFRSYTNELF